MLVLLKGGFGIVNYNPMRTYCPLVLKQYTFSATKGSPQFIPVKSTHSEMSMYWWGFEASFETCWFCSGLIDLAAISKAYCQRRVAALFEGKQPCFSSDATAGGLLQLPKFTQSPTVDPFFFKITSSGVAYFSFGVLQSLFIRGDSRYFFSNRVKWFSKYSQCTQWHSTGGTREHCDF